MAHGERAYLTTRIKLTDIAFDLDRVDVEVTTLYEDYSALEETYGKLLDELRRLATSVDRGVLKHEDIAKIIRGLIDG